MSRISFCGAVRAKHDIASHRIASHRIASPHRIIACAQVVGMGGPESARPCLVNGRELGSARPGWLRLHSRLPDAPQSQCRACSSLHTSSGTASRVRTCPSRHVFLRGAQYHLPPTTRYLPSSVQRRRHPPEMRQPRRLRSSKGGFCTRPEFCCPLGSVHVRRGGIIISPAPPLHGSPATPVLSGKCQPFDMQTRESSLRMRPANGRYLASLSSRPRTLLLAWPSNFLEPRPFALPSRPTSSLTTTKGSSDGLRPSQHPFRRQASMPASTSLTMPRPITQAGRTC